MNKLRAFPNTQKYPQFDSPCLLEVAMKKDRQEQNPNHHPTRASSHNIGRRYSDFFNFAPVGYFTFNRDGLILDVNPNGALMLGTDKSSLLNRPFSHFLAQDSKKIFEQHSQKLFDAGQQKICDLKLLNGNREGRWIQLESVVVQNGGDDQERFRAVRSADAGDLKKT